MQFYIAFLLLFRSVIASECVGDWILALSENLICSTGTFEYKFQSTTDTNVYYLSPQTSTAWSWDTYTEVTGTYQYTTDGGNTLQSFACDGGESYSSCYGVGCSNGPGTQYKAFALYSDNRDVGEANICQDLPGILSSGCASALIYYRECTGSCNIDCGGAASDWIQAFPSNLMNIDSCDNGVLQYKYEESSNPNSFYLSPMTSSIWSWDTYTQVDGIYQYTSDGGNTFGSFECSGGETVDSNYGVGCSTAGGPNWKVIAAYTSTSVLAQAEICQDQPGIFGVSCQQDIDIYYRSCAATCNVDVFECGDAASDWILAVDNLDSVCELGTVFEYKYEESSDPNVYYISPMTSNMWSWDTYTQVTGIYQYTSDGGTTFDSFDCNGGETIDGSSYGIGCSTGGGEEWKTIAAYTSTSDEALANVCQDKPGIFSDACQSDINIYYRTCNGSCNTGNECQNTSTFVWEELVEDAIGKPYFEANMSVDSSTLTLNIDIQLDYLGYSAADNNGYIYGTTYVIDFEDFNAHADNIREPGTCQNREILDILSNAEWADLWSYSTTPNVSDHVGGTTYLAYPPAGEWTVAMSSGDACGTIQYTTSLSWNELMSCTNYDGTLGSYIESVDNANNISLSGTLYINVVSPFDYESGALSYYRVYQILSQPFAIVVSKTVYVLDGVGINLLTMDVIAVYKEDEESTFSLIVLTESAQYLQLTRNGLSQEYLQTFNPSSDNTAGLTSSDFRTLNTTENDGCLSNKQYICSQLWHITADNAKCSADSKYTDFSGSYSIQFDAQCGSMDDLGTNLSTYCNEWLDDHVDEITDSTGKVLLTAKLTWKDEICDPLVFAVQFAAEMQLFADSTYSSPVNDNYLYGVGESTVYVGITSNYPHDTLTVFDTQLLNVWLCTFDPLTPPDLDIDAAKGEGGCFEQYKDDNTFIGHIYDSENDVQKEGFVFNETSDLDSNVIRFAFIVPNKVVRDTLYVHAQVEVSLMEAGSSAVRRRLISTHNMKRANQINHFVHSVAVIPYHDDNPKTPIHNYNDDYYPHTDPLMPPPQTPSVVSLQSPWIIAIGVLLTLLLTINIVYMCYKHYSITDDDNNNNNRTRYSVVKSEDSEFVQDSELDAINVDYNYSSCN